MWREWEEHGRTGSRIKIKPERFRTEQEKTEETEAPKTR